MKDTGRSEDCLYGGFICNMYHCVYVRKTNCFRPFKVGFLDVFQYCQPPRVEFNKFTFYHSIMDSVISELLHETNMDFNCKQTVLYCKTYFSNARSRSRSMSDVQDAGSILVIELMLPIKRFTRTQVLCMCVHTLRCFVRVTHIGQSEGGGAGRQQYNGELELI